MIELLPEAQDGRGILIIIFVVVFAVAFFAKTPPKK